MRLIVSFRRQRQFCLSGTRWLGAFVLTVSCLANGAIGQNNTVKNIDPAQVVQIGTCTDCHQNEVKALQASKHFKSLEKIKAGENVKKYADALKIKRSDVTKNSACTQCHGTPSNAGGAVAISENVSCQSCHGAAKNWLNIHKKLKGAPPAARAGIHAQCQAAGAVRPNNLYAIAKNCFECHVVRNQALVNARHSAATRIELVVWSAGEVRHNFQASPPNQPVNAEAPAGEAVQERRRLKYVVGLMVDAEITLTNLGNVPVGKGKTLFAKANASRLKRIVKALKKVVEAFDGNVPKPIADGYEQIEFRFLAGNFKKMAEAKKAAPLVAKAAEAAAKLDPADLAALDDLIAKKCDKPKGEAYEP